MSSNSFSVVAWADNLKHYFCYIKNIMRKKEVFFLLSLFFVGIFQRYGKRIQMYDAF